MTLPLWTAKLIIKELEDKDLQELELRQLTEVYLQQDSLMRKKETILTGKSNLLKNCEDRVEYLEFLCDVQRNDYKRLEAKRKKQNTWYQIGLGLLAVIFIVK